MRCIGDGDWVWYKMNKPSHSVWETETLSLGRARPYTGVNLQALQLLNKAVLENLEKTFARSDEHNVPCLCLQSMVATSALSLTNSPQLH